MHDTKGRERKAATMVAVLSDYFDVPLHQIRALDMSASTGIIDNHLSSYFGSVLGMDIDSEAIASANQHYSKDNLRLREGDALNTRLPANFVDVVICSQLYEHVPDAAAMVDEVFRILRPGGIC